MEITKLGKFCFKIKGRRVIVLTDPPEKLKNVRAHIVISSASEKNERSEFLFSSTTIQDRNRYDPGSKIKVKGEPVVIFGPGEYEIREVRILGVKEKSGTIYKIEMDNLSLLYLDKLQEKVSEEKVELLSDVDTLFLPVDRPKVASSIISQLEPLIVIPAGEGGIEEFLKGEGIEKVERLSKFVITKGELPEERKIVVLK